MKMKDFTNTTHPAARMYSEEVRAGTMDRREFLTRATALGVAVPAAYGLLGLAAPQAQASTPVRGGSIKMQMDIRAQRDPRTWDWSELSNVCRGWLEYLVQYNRDGSLTPVLLEGWTANADATQYTLNVRRGVKWNNGDDFTAADVAHNFERWADASVEGNSMAARVSGIVEDGKLRAGAIEVIDSHTLQVNLSAGDIALMVSLADYPAAVVHPSFDGDDPVANPIGTGPYLPVRHETGIGAVIERNPNHTWWNEGNGAWLDRIEFVDLGTDPAAHVAATEAGEIDLVYRSQGDFVQIFDAMGMARSDAVTAATLAVRFNQEQEPFTNRDVRRALQKAVNNAVVLELGFAGQGSPAENHHVCPIHPEYAELPPQGVDPAAAKADIEAAGLGDFEFELISLDDDWQADTCNAIAAQVRDAGINIKRTILPGATFWNDWTKYPWSATEWNMRPLGVQVLNLAYRSGVAWNETAFANAEFDALLDQANTLASADDRRVVMRRLQEIMQEEGVLIQPYWRSITRHMRPNIGGADMHPTFEVHYQYYWKS
jgi:peptide/nickel transport system substrate-binding protein